MHMYARSSSRIPSFNFPKGVNSVTNAGKLQEDPREKSPRVISNTKKKTKKFPRREHPLQDDIELKPVVWKFELHLLCVDLIK